MASSPCINPSCHSFGKPHPNCKCQLGMADGGDVAGFCSKDREHSPLCQYYKQTKAQNPEHAIAGYLVHQGLHGLMSMGDTPEMGSYEFSVARGHKETDKAMKALFQGAAYDHGKDVKKPKEKIKEWIQKGGAAQELKEENYNQSLPQSFAEGGAVESNKGLASHPIEQQKPAHNMLLQVAKARMSNYLNTLRPSDIAVKLPYDRKPDQRKQEKDYHAAVEMAAHPLSIVNKIAKGRLGPKDVIHFKSLHPELDGLLSQKMHEKILEDQLENKKPPFKVRQAMSLYLGSPLSANMTPQNIMAAQATFARASADAQAAQQQQQPQKAKGNKPKEGKGKSLSKSDQSFLTSNQAIAERQQKQS